MKNINEKQKIFCPGPTPIPLEFYHATAGCNPYHRTEYFYTVFYKCRELLSKLMYSKQLPIIFSSSGTGALEAAVVNFTAADDEVLVINGGKFGARWSSLCQAYNCVVHEVKIPWGKAPDLEQILQILKKEPAIKAVFFQVLETSTGAAYPIKELSEGIKKKFNPMVIVDAVSGFGSEMIKMDEWGIDVLVTGSQKGLGIPPGLAFVNFSQLAKSRFTDRPRFYFDLRREMQEQEKGKSAFTPATQLVLMLEQSLLEMNKRTMGKIHEAHHKIATALRAAIKFLGLDLFAEKNPACGLTSVLLPDAVDGVRLLDRLATKHKMIFAGGQEQYKGKLLRFAHMGYFDIYDVVSGLIAIEQEITMMGYDLANLGAAQVFWQTYKEL